MSRSSPDFDVSPFRSFLGVTAAVTILAFVVAGLGRYRDLGLQRAREAALLHQIEETERRIEELGREIALLKTDPGTLERVAREELGMVLPGDLVIRFDDDTATREDLP